jgi:pimeloyl-ACP methyl ester carboxylesterase
MSHLSMSEAQVRAYFDAGHLAVISPDALNQVLEAAGIRRWFAEPIDVLGVSTGGSVALQVAADHPEVVRRPVRSIRHAGWGRARAAVSASWPDTLLSGTSDAPGSR